MKINNLTDVSDDKKPLVETEQTSDAVLAEISLRSPRKLFICIIKKIINRIKVSKKTFDLILNEASLHLRIYNEGFGNIYKGWLLRGIFTWKFATLVLSEPAK